MHVRKLHLHSFKRFNDRTFEFIDSETGAPRPLIVLIGNNGCGKTTILQALAATIGTATRRLKLPSELEWPGFRLELAEGSWKTPLSVEVDVGFTPIEIESTSRYFEIHAEQGDRERTLVPPAEEPLVRLKLRDAYVRASTHAQFYQFQGRESVRRILKSLPEGHRAFENVGGVFWFTEQRNATSLTTEDGTEVVRFDEDLLRRRLADFIRFHERVARGEYQLRPGQRDIFSDLAQIWTKVFPRRRFEGVVPRGAPEDVMKEPWVYLSDGLHQYEVSEMSAGERAIFPLLFDFANLGIHHSIVLIDELELHLHPPLQQMLVTTLPHLGKGNQFIITTHSDAVLEVVPSSCVIRLEN